MSEVEEQNTEVKPVDAPPENVKVKRAPGRPCKKVPLQNPKPRKGIVKDPSDERHSMEFLYDKPLVFKKLWQFFKNMAVEKIHMSFLKDSVLIYCHDHHKKNKIRVNIDCSMINHYFCEKEMDIGLLCSNPELIMKTIDKTNTSILILSAKGSTQNSVNIVLKNELDIEETHKVQLIQYHVDDIENSKTKFMDDDYMIKFKLQGKYFKKMITDIKSFSNQITIRKDGPGKNENLVFEYTNNDKKINSSHSIKNSTAISLVDNMKEDDTFRTSFKIDYVKPISSALLTEYINIYSDENKPLKFIIQMDEAIQIVILTDIIDNRVENI